MARKGYHSDLRKRAVWKRLHNSLSYKAIAKDLHISERTCKRFVKVFMDTGERVVAIMKRALFPRSWWP